MSESALDIAAAIVSRHPVDQMKLHKLLYYIQAGSLSWFDRPAFDEPIEAWIYGPVTRRVAGYYKDFDGDLIPGPVTGDASALSPRTEWLVDRVLTEYANLSGPELARLTKQAGTPWREVRRGLPDEEPSDAEIPVSLIRQYHRRHGVFPAVPSEEEEAMARRFLEGDPAALADLFETVTGARPIVS